MSRNNVLEKIVIIDFGSPLTQLIARTVREAAFYYEIINSHSQKSNFISEFDKVWVHGLLHLVGYNHIRNQDYYKMNKIDYFSATAKDLYNVVAY